MQQVVVSEVDSFSARLNSILSLDVMQVQVLVWVCVWVGVGVGVGLGVGVWVCACAGVGVGVGVFACIHFVYVRACLLLAMCGVQQVVVSEVVSFSARLNSIFSLDALQVQCHWWCRGGGCCMHTHTHTHTHTSCMRARV